MIVDDVDPEFAARFTQTFSEVWRAPDLDKHEAVWSDDIVLIQPMSAPMRGKKARRAGFERIFKLIPDLTAEVHSFGHGEKQVFIEFTLSGTYGGKPIAWRAVDRFTFTDGLIAERVSFFDAVPLVLTLLRRPRGWARLRWLAPWAR
jgi:ketosteroid isomerase-like protein